MAITRKGRFFNAVRRNDVQKVGKYLDAGFPIEYASWSGNNALLLAVLHGHKDMAEMLLRRGANFARYYSHDVTGQPRYETLLHVAAERGHKEIVTMLLEHDKYDKSLINKPDADHNTALHLAAAQGQAEIVSILLDHGFDPSAKGENGKTPLGFAHQGRHEAVIGLITGAQKKSEPTAPAPKPPVQATDGWKLVSPHSVAHVSEMTDIGYKLSDVFNFQSRERIRIVNNLKTRADHIETTSFADLPDQKQLGDAYAALIRLGGEPDDSFTAEKALPKARLAPPDARK